MNRPRRSIAEPSTSYQENEELDDSLSIEDPAAQGKKITADDEDIFISIIVKYYDVIENKSSNSLSQKQQQQQIEAWDKVQQELSNETKVSELILIIIIK